MTKNLPQSVTLVCVVMWKTSLFNYKNVRISMSLRMTADGEEQQESASEMEEDNVQRRSEASVSQLHGLSFQTVSRTILILSYNCGQKFTPTRHHGHDRHANFGFLMVSLNCCSAHIFNGFEKQESKREV